MTATATTGKFIEFIGRAAINGVLVAAYQAGENIKLRAETTGSKRVLHSYVDRHGEKQVVTISDAEVTAAQLADLRDEWSRGCADSSDARVVQRAIDWLVHQTVRA